MVKMDRCLRSRRASAARDGEAASVTSNVATQESISDNELERNVTGQTHTPHTHPDTPHTHTHRTHHTPGNTPDTHYTPDMHTTHTYTPQTKHTHTPHTKHTHHTHIHTRQHTRHTPHTRHTHHTHINTTHTHITHQHTTRRTVFGHRFPRYCVTRQVVSTPPVPRTEVLRSKTTVQLIKQSPYYSSARRDAERHTIADSFDLTESPLTLLN
jgi:hypothetical protein